MTDSTIQTNDVQDKSQPTSDYDVLEASDALLSRWTDVEKPSEETEIIGTLERGDIRDILLIKSETVSLKQKDEIEIFTSSPRRKYNLAKYLGKTIFNN